MCVCLRVSIFVPILRSVVIASVAMDLLESATRPSMSSWHLETLRDSRRHVVMEIMRDKVEGEKEDRGGGVYRDHFIDVEENDRSVR